MATVVGFSSGLDGIRNASTAGVREISSHPLKATRKAFSDTYLVRAASLSENEEDVMAASGLPIIGSVSNNAYLVAKYPREIDSGALLWEVECAYDSKIDATRPRLVEYNWYGETIDEVITRDPVTGVPIVNAVGEPLIVTSPFEVAVYVLQRLETTSAAANILNYKNRTNHGNYFGFPPRTVLMADIRDDPAEVGGVLLRKITYVIKVNLKESPDFGIIGWQVELLNQGTKYLVAIPDPGEEAEYEVFRTKDGQPTTGNLNLDGTKRNPLLPPTWLLFNRLPTTNFGPLNIV